MPTHHTPFYHRGSAPLLALALLSGGCADELVADAMTLESARVVTTSSGPGQFTTTVDAADAEVWVYFSFDSGAEVTPADPANSLDWDLAFQRFHIISNGGVSGSGGASVAVLAGQTLESITSAPVDGYVEDQPDSEDDDDAVVDSAFAQGDGWYEYDGATNRLSPRETVYVVQTSDIAHHKLEILDYYDAAGTSGHPTFAWAGF